jgi:type IV secretory pathway TrbL component
MAKLQCSIFQFYIVGGQLYNWAMDNVMSVVSFASGRLFNSPTSLLTTLQILNSNVEAQSPAREVIVRLATQGPVKIKQRNYMFDSA